MGWSCKKAKTRCVALIPCNCSVNAPIKPFIYHGGALFLQRKPPSLILHLTKLEPHFLFSPLSGEYVFRHSYEKPHGITNAIDFLVIHPPITLNSHSKQDFLYYRLETRGEYIYIGWFFVSIGSCESSRLQWAVRLSTASPKGGIRCF